MSQDHPPLIFISYSHKDSRLREQLEVFLAPLKRQNVEIWSDTALKAGDEWDSKILYKLSTADIILLLISANFLASKYIIEKELQQVMERHENGEAIVIPVFLKPCDWKGEVFGKLQGLPSDDKPITRWSDHDMAFTIVAREIRKIVNDRQSKWVTHFEHVEKVEVQKSGQNEISPNLHYEIDPNLHFFIQCFLDHFIGPYELMQLERFVQNEKFIVDPIPSLEVEFRRLLQQGLIARIPGKGIRTMMRSQSPNVREHFQITEAGQKFLNLTKKFSRKFLRKGEE